MSKKFDLTVFEHRIQISMSIYLNNLHLITDTTLLWDIIKKKSDILATISDFQIWEYSDDQIDNLAEIVFYTKENLSMPNFITRLDSLSAFKEGRLFVFFPNDSFGDGTAEAVSGGFFNTFNFPCYFSWLYYIGANSQEEPIFPHLICWCPPELTNLVNDGIETNPDLSLIWFDDITYSISYKQQLISICEGL